MKREKTEKIKAVVLGHAIADALGVSVEFCPREELEAAPVTDMQGFGTYPVPAGCFSDDTSMALAALESLSGGSFDPHDVMQRLGEWYYNGKYTPTGETFDVGSTCATAIENYFEAGMSISECGLRGERSNGNGSLMRIHPFALFVWLDAAARADWESVIDRASALTHAHGRAKLGCKIYTTVLLALLARPEKPSVTLALHEAACRYRSHAEYTHYERVFSPDFFSLPRDKIKSTGYVVDTLEAALWCLLITDSYEECVLMAVNLGDDTDTVAAVAGALAGALYGREAIPARWLAMLQKREDVEALCERAATAFIKAK